MAKSHIKIADSVRRVLSRHYINPHNVRILVSKGHVRLIGGLERVESKAYMPIDEDSIAKLKNEIHHVEGVKSVAISSSFEEKIAEKKSQEAGTTGTKDKAGTALDRKEAQKKAMEDALKAALARKREELKTVDKGKEEPEEPVREEPLGESESAAGALPEETEPQEEKADFKIKLDEEDLEKPVKQAPDMAVSVVPYKAYPTLLERTWIWGEARADDALGNNDWERFKATHLFWETGEPEGKDSPETKNVYHMPHHVMHGGTLKTHWPGVVFALAALLGEGTAIGMSRLKFREAYRHLSRHYTDQFGKHAPELIETAPPEKSYAECAPGELIVQAWDYSEFKQYHESQGINMWWLTLEAWEAAVSGVKNYGFHVKKKQEEQAEKSGRLFKKLSARFKSALGHQKKTSLAEPVSRLAGVVADVVLRLERDGVNRRQSEKLLNLAGALRTFVERYSHASKFDISYSHADILHEIDGALGRVFEHIAPVRYVEEDLAALLAAVDEIILLASRHKEE